MNLAELKKLLKPLIREAVKEIILEEQGILSHIIKESVNAAKGSQPLQPSPIVESLEKPMFAAQQNKNLPSDVKAKLSETKKKLLESIGKSAYNGVDLFAGTEPLREAPAVQTGYGAVPSPLSHVAPDDPGVSVDSIPGSHLWAKIAAGKSKKIS